MNAGPIKTKPPQGNLQGYGHLNRKDRRKAEKLVQRGYDDERLSHELKQLSSERRKSPLLRLWKRIKNWDNPYYTHIPKAVRPMKCVGYKEGVPIMVADHMKCEAIRSKSGR